CMQHLDFPWTF
nr:immunoglobulin light chain junction region [Macaca mulatta]